MPTRRWPVRVVLAAVALAGCADDPGPPATTPTPRDATTAVPRPATTPTPPPATPEPSVALPDPSPPGRMPAADDRALQDAINDLRARLGLARDEVTVVTDELVTWRDGSLGCPRPGEASTQALVEGRRVVLAAAGEHHHYHGRRTGPLTWCEDPDPDGWID